MCREITILSRVYSETQTDRQTEKQSLADKNTFPYLTNNPGLTATWPQCQIKYVLESLWRSMSRDSGFLTITRLSHDLSKMADLLQLSSSLSFLLLFSSFLVLIIPCYSVERKITTEVYNCSRDHSISIFYVRAEDPKQKNVVQFIWSVFETPSIIVAYTSKKKYSKKSGLKINCAKLLQGSGDSITFNLEYDYIVGFEISELHEFSDSKDNVIFSKSDFDGHKHSINKTYWRIPHKEEDTVTFYGDFLNGNISFQCQPAQNDGRDKEPPKQLYSSNSTRFSISLTDLHLNTTDSRIALKLLTHTQKGAKDKTCVMEDQSIDDEYSPGVFRTFVINDTVLNADGLSSFTSWKPVSFNDEPKGINHQVPSYQYLYDSSREYPHSKVDGSCKELLISSSEDHPSKVVRGAMTVRETYPIMVSFGQNKDGWYQSTKKLIWSGQVGYGKPQFDKISSTVLITIIVGIGTPFVVILAGSIYICVKKYKERMTTSTYGKIN